MRVEVRVDGMIGIDGGTLTGTTGTGTEGETGTECIGEKIQDLDTQAAILDRPVLMGFPSFVWQRCHSPRIYSTHRVSNKHAYYPQK